MARKLAVCAILCALGCGGRSGISENPPDAGRIGDGAPDGPTMLEVDCGEPERFTQPGRPIALTVELRGPAPIEKQQWRMVAQPDESEVSLDPTSGTVTGLNPDVVGLYKVAFEGEDAEGTRVNCAYDVVATREPPVVECPDEPLSAILDRPLEIRGQGDRVFTWQWEVLATPPGGEATLEPMRARTVTFTATEMGDYRLGVTGFGVDGASEACELTVEVRGGPEVQCPDGPIEAPTRQPMTLEAEAEDDTGIASVRWEVLERPEQSSTSPNPANARRTNFTPDRQGDYVLEFTATDVDGLEASCEVELVGTPTPPDALCPDRTFTEPLDTVELEGDGVDDGEVVAYGWEVTRRPAGSSGLSPQPPDARRTSFTPDVAGEYVLRLTVTDDDGQTGQCDVEVVAQPQEGLRVEIFWNGPPDRSCDENPEPGCDGSDVDVHLRRPETNSWFDPEGDCHWANCDASRGHRLNWGGPGVEDDPRLDIDDLVGFGPENINIDEPLPGTYRVGVDFWDGHNRNTADVVVNIYCGDGTSEPVATFGPVTLRDRGATRDSNDFWIVADVAIREARPCRVIDLSEGGEPRLIRHGQAEFGR